MEREVELAHLDAINNPVPVDEFLATKRIGLGHKRIDQDWLIAEFKIGIIVERGYVPEGFEDEYSGAVTGRHYIVAPYYTPGGRVESYKSRLSDGSPISKNIRGWSCKKDTYVTSLYGVWRMEGHDTVVVTEGETDTWAAAWEFHNDPIDVVGLPTGACAPRPEWREHFEGRTVVLLFDGRDSDTNDVSPRTAQIWRDRLKSYG